MIDEIFHKMEERLKEVITQTIQEELKKMGCGTAILTREEDLITFNEALRLLKISRPTLFKYMHTGLIPYKKIGRRLLFNKNEIIDTLNKSTKK